MSSLVYLGKERRKEGRKKKERKEGRKESLSNTTQSPTSLRWLTMVTTKADSKLEFNWSQADSTFRDFTCCCHRAYESRSRELTPRIDEKIESQKREWGPKAQGVYDDLPRTTDSHDVTFLRPTQIFVGNGQEGGTEEKMASVAIDPQLSMVTRVANLPLVSSTYDLESSAYISTKDQHPYLRSVCEMAEKGVKTLEPQIAVANTYACKGLDRTEERLPILSQLTAEIVANAKGAITGAKDVVMTTVAGARDSVASTITGW
ncbi:hypothetical protein U0070_009341 [Myodes glareolus]|uniref:Uncharacterized protein n=1 Tax=Myodes glareolus TaxID=447135 RepID=A0AAW0I7Z7_MYOGA